MRIFQPKQQDTPGFYRGFLALRPSKCENGFYKRFKPLGDNSTFIYHYTMFSTEQSSTTKSIQPQVMHHIYLIGDGLRSE